MKTNAEQKIKEQPNKAPHRTGIPLCSIPARELQRWTARPVLMIASTHRELTPTIEESILTVCHQE